MSDTNDTPIRHRILEFHHYTATQLSTIIDQLVEAGGRLVTLERIPPLYHLGDNADPTHSRHSWLIVLDTLDGPTEPLPTHWQIP